ncbi:hypothetical protein N0V90_006645 [Kalmusia sp. IMI 367209]|nr:hypothetical protein N0V90_006645 [Kalmusia sp. IMI 367209]
METLKNLELYVDYCLETLGEQLNKRHLFSLDVIGEITWSANLCFICPAADDGTFVTIRSIARFGCWLGHVPYVYRLHKFFRPPVGNWLSVSARHGDMRDFKVPGYVRRMENPGGEKDFISQFFNVHKKPRDGFRYTEVISTGTAQLSAGSDTVAVTMRVMMYHLRRNQATKEKLISKIDEARSKEELSNPVNYKASELEYLQAVISA